MAFENVSKYKEQIYRCNSCGRCPRGPWDPNQPAILPLPERQCPIYETHKLLSYSSQGMILIIRDLLEGKIEPSESLVSAIHECLLCQHCNAVCAATNDIPLGELECAQIFQALRTDLVEMGFAPPSLMESSINKICEKHNRMGTDLNRGAWAEGMDIPTKGATMIFAGCTAAYQNNEVVQSLAKIMQTAGMDFGMLEDEWCCGALQHDSGMLEDFKTSVQHNVDAIKAAGAKEIVMVCADGYKAIKKDYPKYAGELGFDVLHSVELMAKLVREKKISLNKVDLGGKATYSDPCLLARDNGVIDQPREVLNAIPGIELVEMEGFGKYTNCCGRPIVAPASKKACTQAGQNRIKDALAVEAKTIITGCVNCKQSMTRSAKKIGAEIKVMDIVEVVVQAIS